MTNVPRFNSSFQLWDDNRRLWSLYDMLTFSGSDFQGLMSILPRFQLQNFSVAEIGDTCVNPQYAANLKTACRECLEHCQNLRLHASSVALRRFIDSDIQKLDFWTLDHAIKEIESRIHDELEGQLFLYVPYLDAGYYNEPNWIGIDVLLRFPSVEAEATEAASCYALSRYTACVFHLMRLLEYGLASLADSLAVPIANPNWHHVLQGCEGKIKDLIKHDPDWKDNEQFYNAAALEFRHFQRALRNHTAHAKDMYSQADARSVMDHVATFMQTLAKRLHEVPMP